MNTGKFVNFLNDFATRKQSLKRRRSGHELRCRDYRYAHDDEKQPASLRDRLLLDKEQAIKKGKEGNWAKEH